MRALSWCEQPKAFWVFRVFNLAQAALIVYFGTGIQCGAPDLILKTMTPENVDDCGVERFSFYLYTFGVFCLKEHVCSPWSRLFELEGLN